MVILLLIIMSYYFIYLEEVCYRPSPSAKASVVFS